MEDYLKQERESIRDLESLKTFCNNYLFEIVQGSIYATNSNPFIKIRFIDLNGNFGFTKLGKFFFIEDRLYLITNEEKYRDFHNPDILDQNTDLEILKYTQNYIVNAVFAGIYTGFRDDYNEWIFTGDVVEVEFFQNPIHPSIGGLERAKNDGLDSSESSSLTCKAGVRDIFGNYSMIFDNNFIPLSWATKIVVIGTLFYDVSKFDSEIDINSLCNCFAQARNQEELIELIKDTPHYRATTWQEQAKEILCGRNSNE